jgi:diguanylate cyclase (GGDEF)-like protein
MRKRVHNLTKTDPALHHKLAFIEQGYLVVVALIGVLALWGRLIPALSHVLSGDWVSMTPPIAIAALVSAAALEFAGPRHTGFSLKFGVGLACLLILLAAAAMVEDFLHIPVGIDRIAAAFTESGHAQGMPALTAGAFLALALMLVVSPSRKGPASFAADVFVSVLCLLVLVMIRGYLFEGLSSGANGERTSLLTLLALSLLAFVAFMQRAQVGAFSTLLGEGSGSKMARIAAPIVLLVPFLPRTTLADAVRSGRLRTDYLTAAAEILAGGVCLALMLYMAWKINQLETRVRDLSLRDDATGLHNRRGFHLVAWQALRQARRDNLPFSILFIEVDNLGEVHESLGYPASAEMLAEMAEVMNAAFRATDVMGRIDPAQFALAGHFDEKAAAVMRLRVREAINYRNANPGRSFTIAFSMGFVHAKDVHNESLEDLLAEADNAIGKEPQGAQPVVGPTML